MPALNAGRAWEKENDRMSSKDHVKKSVQNGITFGSALAMVISYANWHSVFWAIVHGLFSWGYVIYYVIRY